MALIKTMKIHWLAFKYWLGGNNWEDAKTVAEQLVRGFK